jgi:hypothetical protein
MNSDLGILMGDLRLDSIHLASVISRTFLKIIVIGLDVLGEVNLFVGGEPYGCFSMWTGFPS